MPLHRYHGLSSLCGSALMLSSYFLITAKNFRRWQSLAVGIVTVGGSSGLLIMGPLLQLLIDSFGWRGAFRNLSIPFFVMACVCGVTFGDPALPDISATTLAKKNQCDSKLLSESEAHPEMEMDVINKKQDRVHEEKKVKITADDCPTETRKISQMRSSHVAAKTDSNTVSNCLGKLNALLNFSVFKIPRYSVAVLSLCLMKFGHFIPQIHMVNYCLELGISADSASRFFIPFGLSSSVARVVTGRICDATWVNTIYIYQFGALLDGFAIVVLPVIRNYAGIQVFAVIYGIADGVLISTMNSLLMFSVHEKRRAAALGVGNSLLSLAMASGPPFAGFLVDLSDCYTWPFFIAGIVLHMAGLVPLVLFCLEEKTDSDLKEDKIRKSLL
ncbi:monocarboxylate transporter 12-like isoform X3 [Stylophora pistillata]|uniref:monocarboxylate transporter 12-like isoform X3 n=1 Tax=Stylophora pistillata TaxID=50429 RepID=UPI000C03F77A|nr:monocarboxylate transporter 12-like isoform X3 [Stylophora pistillata]